MASRQSRSEASHPRAAPATARAEGGASRFAATTPLPSRRGPQRDFAGEVLLRTHRLVLRGLCLGDAEEGFGLAAAESVATGTPVLAMPVGFLAEMLPPDHGIFLASREAEGPELLDLARRALRVGRRQCLAAGRPYVAARYGIERMRGEMARIAADVSS